MPLIRAMVNQIRPVKRHLTMHKEIKLASQAQFMMCLNPTVLSFLLEVSHFKHQLGSIKYHIGATADISFTLSSPFELLLCDLQNEQARICMSKILKLLSAYCCVFAFAFVLIFSRVFGLLGTLHISLLISSHVQNGIILWWTMAMKPGNNRGHG